MAVLVSVTVSPLLAPAWMSIETSVPAVVLNSALPLNLTVLKTLPICSVSAVTSACM